MDCLAESELVNCLLLDAQMLAKTSPFRQQLGDHDLRRKNRVSRLEGNLQIGTLFAQTERLNAISLRPATSKTAAN